jgi:hypothetical protein
LGIALGQIQPSANDDCCVNLIGRYQSSARFLIESKLNRDLSRWRGLRGLGVLQALVISPQIVVVEAINARKVVIGLGER